MSLGMNEPHFYKDAIWIPEMGLATLSTNESLNSFKIELY